MPLPNLHTHTHLPCLPLQPHVESATIYGLRPSALLVFIPKYHLKVGRGSSGEGGARRQAG